MDGTEVVRPVLLLSDTFVLIYWCYISLEVLAVISLFQFWASVYFLQGIKTNFLESHHVIRVFIIYSTLGMDSFLRAGVVRLHLSPKIPRDLSGR